LGEAQWAGAFQSLIAALTPALDSRDAMLLRVGRHSGAESVTLERHRWIRIMEGPGKAHWARDATTIWLAADREDSRADLRPFGWLLVERADRPLTGDHLKRWCDAEAALSQGDKRPSSLPPDPDRPRTASSAGRAGPQPAAPPGMSSLQFRRGDRVRNADGEVGIIISDVKIGENTMTIEIDGDLETVRVTEWKAD
jgi:hypothetical protein